MNLTPTKREALVSLVTAIVTALLTFFTTIMTSSCQATHKVTQSAYSTATGDSIVIRYEQIGKFKK